MLDAWYGNPGWAHGAYGFGFPWGGLVMGILFLVFIGLFVFTLVRLGRIKGLESSSARERGLEILTERFARGEIDAEAFRAMKLEIEKK